MRRHIPVFMTALLSGCAVHETKAVTETYLRTETLDGGTDVVKAFEAKFNPEEGFRGGTIAITTRASTRCLTKTQNVYSRTEHVRRSPTIPYLGLKPRENNIIHVATGATGAVVMGAATYRFLEAPSLSDEEEIDPDTGEKLTSDQDAAYNQAYVGFGCAAPMLGWAIVEAFRTKDARIPLGQAVKESKVDAKECSRAIASGTVTMGAPDRRAVLGTTDSAGVLTVELARFLRADLSRNEPLQLDGESMGELDIPLDLHTFLVRGAGVRGGTAGRRSLASFIDDYPKSFLVEEARTRLAKVVIEEDAAFSRALSAPSTGRITELLARYPDAADANTRKATAALQDLEYAEAAAAGTPEALREFARKYPESPLSARANERADSLSTELRDKALTAHGGEGFQNLRWGMSKGDVKTLRPALTKSLDNVDSESLEVAGLPAFAYYSFTKSDRLSAVSLAFQQTYVNPNGYSTAFATLKELLTKKYGAPKIDRVTWRNDLYRNDPQHFGVAVSVGHVVQIAVWETLESEIKLAHHGENFKNHVVIWYASKALANQHDADRAAEALKDL